MRPKVTQLTTDNYRPVANHFVIDDENATYLQSYQSIVVKCEGNGWKRDTVTLGKHWDYSRTTMKYVGQYLGENAKSIRAKIKSGEFKYDGEMV